MTIDDPARSPSITSNAWGSLVVSGSTYKDAKLWPGGARAWDWGETGTSHERGIGAADTAELLDHGARVVILSRGRAGRLHVPAETVIYLRDRGAVVEVLLTPDAIRRYNELAAQGELVAALIHSTC